MGLKAHMHQLLLAQQQRHGLSVLMITHDLMEAVALADQVLVMQAAPGRLVWQLDLGLPPSQRDEAWVYRHTAALMAEPVVRQAFALPERAVSAGLPDGDASCIGSGQAIGRQNRPTRSMQC